MKKDRKTILKYVLIGFFAVMILLTILSRIIDSIIIPKVEIISSAQGNLNYVISGEGVVEVTDKEFVEIPKELKADRVLSVGQKVEAGQGIVFLRIAALEEQKKELDRELKKMQLGLEREKLNQTAPARLTEQEILAVEVTIAQKDFTDAQTELQKAQEKYSIDLEKANSQKERDKWAAQRRFSISNEETDKINQVSGNQVVQSYSQAELSYSEAIAIINDTYDSTLEQLAKELKDAENKVQQQQDVLNLLQLRIELAAKSDSNTKKNDKTAALISGKSQEILQVDLEELKEETIKIEELLQVNGELKSKIDGYITKMGIIPGTVTTGDEIVEIGSGTFQFVGNLNKEDTGLVEKGDEVEIMMMTESKVIKGTITEIIIQIGTEDRAEPVYAKFVAELEEGNYQIGSSAEFTVKKSSKLAYDSMIPLSALREDSKGTYCLIAETKPTILGDEEIAVRVNVTVVKKDEAKAAVESAFTEADRIIAGSNKAIAEGDRVRIQP